MVLADSGAPRPHNPGRVENEALAERMGVMALSLEVERTESLTPSCRGMRLSGRDLADLDPLPGQDLMISLDHDGERTTRRRYTIRRLDRAGLAVDLNITLHDDGPGTRWATTAEPGQRVEAIGPRGKITLDPQARWHLFIGDHSFASAALNMAEAVPEDQTVVLAIGVDRPDHQHPGEIRARLAGPRWVVRDGDHPDDPAALLAALVGTELPSGRGHAYVGGEYGLVAAVRDVLIARGMAVESVSHKPYWRLGRHNAANGEPERT